MIQDFIIPFIAILLAELGDKTQIAIFLLASKTKKNLQLFLGVMAAFAITDGLAIALGDFLGSSVSIESIKIASGIVFIFFGLVTFLNGRKESSKESEIKNPALAGFLMILVSEMGDKTQIASGVFAAQYNPFFVFAGVIGALALVSIFSIYLGKVATKKINRSLVSKIAGAVFILIGLSFLFY